MLKGLVLAGGHGTRLRPLTFSGNKHMLPIANQPVLFYGLKHLAQAGIRDVAVVLGPLHEGIQEAVGDGHTFGLRVRYVHQGDPKGLAHAVLCARPFLQDDPFVMYLGDNLLQEGVSQFVHTYQTEHPEAVVGAAPVSNPRQYGIVELEGERIVSIEEKPPHPRSNLALVGVYLFTAAIHPIIERLGPSSRGELEITEAIWKLHKAGSRVLTRRVTGWWKDTGRPEDLLEANELVLRTSPPEFFRNEGAVSRGAHLRGHVGVGPGSVVEDDVEIDGPVILGKGVRVAGGSRVGASTAIGDSVTLRAASVRRSIILEGSTIEGPLRIADSLIGRNVDIRGAVHSDHEVVLTVGDSARLRL